MKHTELIFQVLALVFFGVGCWLPPPWQGRLTNAAGAAIVISLWFVEP